MNKNKTFICFCEDVTLEDVIKAIEKGYDDIETLKRFTGVGTKNRASRPYRNNATCQARL
jgi:NAD(P)H-nitrite reductase large subunit